ncbi:MAG: Na/Pi cotransporter family protein, partial [Ruminococcus sp.]|nr:Na/Pi cotransporter family protein [Ruminococcus sp.]
AIALENCYVVATDMAHWSMQSFDDGVKALFDYNEKLAKFVRDAEKMTDKYEDKLGSYLVKLSSSSISERESAQASMLLKVIGDFERISDHARNIMLSGEELSEKKLAFSDDAKAELKVLSNAVSEIIDLAFESFMNNDVTIAVKVESLEEVIDGLKEKMRTNHTKRLQKGNCSLDTGFVWSDLLTNFERISDHCSNIVGAVVDFEHNDLNTHKALRNIRRSGEEFNNSFNEYSQKYQLV